MRYRSAGCFSSVLVTKAKALLLATSIHAFAKGSAVDRSPSRWLNVRSRVMSAPSAGRAPPTPEYLLVTCFRGLSSLKRLIEAADA
jgi:hypothetical protein